PEAAQLGEVALGDETALLVREHPTSIVLEAARGDARRLDADPRAGLHGIDEQIRDTHPEIAARGRQGRGSGGGEGGAAAADPASPAGGGGASSTGRRAAGGGARRRASACPAALILRHVFRTMSITLASSCCAAKSANACSRNERHRAS